MNGTKIRLKWLMASAAVLLLGYGCAAGGEAQTDDDQDSSGEFVGGSTTGSGAGGNTTGQGGSSFSNVASTSGSGGQKACAKFTEEAELAPAAMLVALDMTASMTGQKWSTSQLAVVSAVDKDVFDTMSLGLVTFPVSFSQPPKCVCDYVESILGPGTCSLGVPNGVSCGVSGLPQVALAPAGKDKANSGKGPRGAIYNYLTTHSPISADDDGSPIYEALVSGYNALKAYAGVKKRMLVLITDGGFSCTSLSNPTRAAFQDGYGCLDWEHPDNVNKLINDARTDPNTPINTLVIGVPGSNTNGGKSGKYDNAPYPMQLALSTYAVSGSPDTVDPTCDKGAVFSKTGSVPAKPCHIDLSASNFQPNMLADAIASLRGKTLGCIYPLPEAPPGETINLNQVNVRVTIDDMPPQTYPKRSDPSDTCLQSPCWDYSVPDNDVVILGVGCENISKATTAKVEVEVGCDTIVK